MAFVNEKSKIIGESRTIDYERGAILKMSGGAWVGPGGNSFLIKWGEDKILIGVKTDLKYCKENPSLSTMTYTLDSCSYPEHLRPFVKEIRSLIKDGLETFGLMYGNSDNVPIRVIIPGTLRSLNPNFNWDTGKIEMDPIEYKKISLIKSLI